MADFNGGRHESDLVAERARVVLHVQRPENNHYFLHHEWRILHGGEASAMVRLSDSGQDATVEPPVASSVLDVAPDGKRFAALAPENMEPQKAPTQVNFW